MSEGIRVTLWYAWFDGDVDAQPAGEPVGDTRAKFSELRTTVGGLVNLHPVYVDFEMIDLIERDLRRPLADARRQRGVLLNLCGHTRLASEGRPR